MDFFETIQKRHSVRQFSSQAVSDELLQRILEAANCAPSAGNLQAYEIYVVRNPDRRAALTQAAHGQEFLTQAPVVLAFCSHAERSRGRYGQRGESLYCIQDATIACTFAMLAATAQGLATVWVGAFDEKAVHQILGAPQGIIPLALLPVGFPAEEPESRPRQALKDLVHR
jgi:nitroreductase